FPACSIKKDASRVISLDELKALVVAGADTDVQFLDTRSSDEYTGAAAHGNARPGHVPRALHLEWSDTLQPNGQFKSTDELIALVAAAGLSADQPVVTYCQRGIRAAHTAYVLEELLGFPAVRVYEAGSRLNMNADDACGVCKRPEIPAWLAVPKGSVAEQLETANVALEELVALKLKRKAQGATSREMVQLSIQVKTHQQSIWQLQQLREQCQGSWCPHCGHLK
ncbi:hypothetical protein DYB26_014202, partial [Aphanomyces astaci]